MTPSFNCSDVIQNVIAFRPAPGRLSLPDLCCDITVVNGRAYFTGPMTHATASPYVNQDVLLLRINVSAARRWVGVPVSDLTDRIVPLEDIGLSLNDAVLRALQARRLVVVPRLERPADDRRFAAAARMLLSGQPVRDVADAVALSERQLERLIVDRVGVSPKLFARIARFRRAAVAARSGVPLADVAATHGYADQSHFARDVHAFTGRSWRALLGNFGDVGFVQDADRLASVGCE